MSADARLTRMVHEVRELDLGDATSYEAGHLTVGEQSVLDLVRDPAFAEVRLGVASPGDSVRIVGVLDAVQPCSKGPGGGGVFPGLLGVAMPVGRGTTHVLRGAAVMAAGSCRARRRRSSTCPGRPRRCRRSPRRTTSSSSGRPPRTRTGWTSTWPCARGSSGWRPISPRRLSTPNLTPWRSCTSPGHPRAESPASGSSSTSRPRASSRTSSSTGAASPVGCRPSSPPQSSTTAPSSAGSSGIPR